jgi:hypothetical protein
MHWPTRPHANAPTSRDTCSTDELSSGNSRATIRSLTPVRIEPLPVSGGQQQAASAGLAVIRHRDLFAELTTGDNGFPRDEHTAWEVGVPNDASDNGVSIAKYARDVIAEEIKFRRDRRQQIFSWASSLLVAIIGGSTALASAKQFQLTTPQRLGLYAAIAIIGGFSAYWVGYHYNQERLFRDEARERGKILGLPDSLYASHKLDWTNIAAILGLTGAALITVYFDIGL